MTDPTHDNATAGLVRKLRSRAAFLSAEGHDDDADMDIRAADAITALQSSLEAATARADKAEAALADLREDRIPALQRNLSLAVTRGNAALSRVTEAKAEGMREAVALVREAFDVGEIHVMGEVVYTCDLSTAADAYRVLIEALTPAGADAAQQEEGK